MSNDCSAGCDRPAMYCARCLALANGGKLAEVERDRDEWRTTCTSLAETQIKLVEALKKLKSYNEDIRDGKINYRPQDHIDVTRFALGQLEETN